MCSKEIEFGKRHRTNPPAEERKRRFRISTLALGVAGGLLSLGASASVALAEAAPAGQPGPVPPPDPARIAKALSLPDWSGTWRRVGTNVFDLATARPRTATAGIQRVRERPPYKAEWEAKYVKVLAQVAAGKFKDPITLCIPRGMPGMMAQPSLYQFVVTPEQVWVMVQLGQQTRRIYTDGRAQLAGDDLFATYTGDSIGRWEGDTLVVTTVGLRDDLILDLTGASLSGDARIVERIRRVNPTTLQDRIAIEDPTALSHPWTVTQTYILQPSLARFPEYACRDYQGRPIPHPGPD